MVAWAAMAEAVALVVIGGLVFDSSEWDQDFYNLVYQCMD